MKASGGFAPSFVERKVLAQQRKLVQSWKDLPHNSNKATLNREKKKISFAALRLDITVMGYMGYYPTSFFL